MASAAFEAAQNALEHSGGMDRWNARGALQLALMDAGLEAANVNAAQMKVVVDRLLPSQLKSQKVADIPTVCARVQDALAMLGADSAAEAPDKIFERLAR
jgi:hypothetical protein